MRGWNISSGLYVVPVRCGVPCRLAYGKMPVGEDFRQQDEPPWTCFEGLVDEPD